MPSVSFTSALHNPGPSKHFPRGRYQLLNTGVSLHNRPAEPYQFGGVFYGMYTDDTVNRTNHPIMIN